MVPTFSAAFGAAGSLVPLTLAADAGEMFSRYGIPAVKVIVILAVAYLVGKVVEKLIHHTSEKTRLDTTVGRFLGKLAKWAILVLALLSVLSIFGVRTTSFAAVLGASVLAIGLAFQGTLANFAAGIMLMTFRPFKVGDVVKVAGESGIVHEIDLFNTVIDTFDNQRVIVPNGQVFGNNITNVNFHPTRRVDVNVGTEYSADLDAVRQTLYAAVGGIDHVLDEPEPAVVLLELGDSSINWVVRVWVNTPDFWSVRDALTRAVKMHLDQANIGIPFPQMDVHVDNPE